MKHECMTYRDGDEIVYRCPLCPKYELRQNFKTNKMWVMGSTKISHYGFFGPENVDFNVSVDAEQEI